MEETLLYRLLGRLAAGELSEAEKEQLAVYFADENGKEALQAVLEVGFESEVSASFDEEHYLPLLKSVLSADKEAPVVRGRFQIKRWWMAAAVLLLVVGATAVVMLGRRGRVDNGVVVVADASPGRNQAILTLANGTKVVLDSAHNGMLAEQGGSRVVKDDSGRLAYNIVGGDGSAIVLNELSTPRGGQYELTLSDGTKVWLNAAASIKYPARFEGGDRVVSVTGEAYFEVAKDMHRPFRVRVNDMTVDVLGTRFNVNAYADEPVIRTTLLEGSVRVSRGGAVVLHPGEQARVGDSVTLAAGVDLDEVMAWKNGFFVFRNADLPAVLRQLSRWYDLDIVYEGQVPEGRFEGKIPRDAMASQVFSLLEKNQVHFRIVGKKLYIK